MEKTTEQRVSKLEDDMKQLRIEFAQRTKVTLANGDVKVVTVDKAIELMYGMLYALDRACSIFVDFSKIYFPVRSFFIKWYKPIKWGVGLTGTAAAFKYGIALLKYLNLL